ncbi:MAG TPA: sigma-54 dependent transcriptional regulator [Stellaceae bacterium]|nr:sigma-54 dependent transcriptional regulator [Stellaceae bacterium]
MLSNRVAAIQPNVGDAPNVDEIGRIGAAGLSKFLLELCVQDPALRKRVHDLISTGARTQAVDRMGSGREDGEDFSGYMVGASPAMMRIFDSIRRFAASNAPVLITGDSGTGKELVARAMHERSAWKNGPFVAINCGAIPTTLISSELFGYEKGAFTGAATRKIGRIEAAENGTVFLDEIGDLPLETQVHLLRFLQEKTIERVGSCKSITINTRVIAATNINLRQAVAERRFREDLYYRLNVLTLALPPLRERGEDVQLLAKFFLQRFADELGRPDLVLSSAAEACIASYTWPGNVRELIACIRRAAVMADGSAIEVRDLGLIQTPKTPDGDNQDLLKARAETEVQLVRQTLERNRFNIKRSAKDLHISRMTLYRLIQKHGIAIDRTPGRSSVPLGADRSHA